MEKQATSKRERADESDESGRHYEEPEVSVTKRLRKDINVCEIMSKMDNKELSWDVEEIDEEMVWDIMKILDEETGNDSISTGEYKDCSFNAEIDYLFGASDEELGIHCSPSVNDYEYDSFSGFFEWIEIELAEKQLLLQMWLDYGESVEEGSHLF